MSGLVQRIHDAVHGQTQPTVTVLSSLLAVEDELGYIPKEALEFVAEFSNATVNDVWAVASFYPNFRFDHPAEHVVDVCWGASCHLVGAMNIFKSVLEAAGLDDEGDTPDKRLTVRFNSCLGACSQAPVIAMDHHLAGRVNPESAANHVTRLLQQDGHGK
ncbi:MAG: NAD(P)H-dependent oxidoreductase subunit E [Dehalococcoidia bacterium]|nr:NAD(P)H-dependent oxidoreductase subunit E [Dehalococcoidia bacterium]|tara:strand:+ start:2873 stop:3352 length:480 start_codon:yes stop_codon:yes gene_type:complete